MKNNAEKIIKRTIILTMIVFALFSPFAYADELSTDLTEDATNETNNNMSADLATDDYYRSYWYTNNAANRYLQIQSDELIKYLYVAYAFKPTELVIQTSQDGAGWEDIVFESGNEYYHITYTFDTPCKFIRIMGTPQSQGKFGIVEYKIFSQGTLPEYVQIWQPAYEDVDMLIFSAHPDDEAVFFSGLIPYYAGEMDKNVAVVYMTSNDPTRRSEALNYQWAMHQTNLPLFAYFEDVFEEDAYGYTRSRWGEQKTIDYMVNVIREKQPEVIVSHDLGGEYGHGNHMFTAVCLLKAVELANDPNYHLESYEQFGLHETKKLYLHLYEENQIHMTVFDEPLDEYDGMSAIEAAQVGILQYASQLRHGVVKVHGTESEYSCYDYGLAYTTVGYDTKDNDMFENTEPESTPTAESTSTPVPTPTAEVTPIAGSTASAEPSESSIMNLGETPTMIITLVAGIILLVCIIFIIILARKLSKKG